MERRNLLKAIPALLSAPIIYKGMEVGKSIETAPSKYIVFVNPDLVDVEEFCRDPNLPIPAGTLIHCVRPYTGQSIDEAIRIYKVED